PARWPGDDLPDRVVEILSRLRVDERPLGQLRLHGLEGPDIVPDPDRLLLGHGEGSVVDDGLRESRHASHPESGEERNSSTSMPPAPTRSRRDSPKIETNASSPGSESRARPDLTSMAVRRPYDSTTKSTSRSRSRQ